MPIASAPSRFTGRRSPRTTPRSARSSPVRTIGRDKDTAWIVTGDVGVDAAAHVPFLEDDSLDEGALAVPLVVRGLGRLRARSRRRPTSVDVARTSSRRSASRLRRSSAARASGRSRARRRRRAPAHRRHDDALLGSLGSFRRRRARARGEGLQPDLDPDCVTTCARAIRSRRRSCTGSYSICCPAVSI